jgi:hypothetical protein
MHHQYFPACPVKGPIEPPAPFNHLGIQGAIPNKCNRCEFMFEGGCTRYFDKVQHYMHLDFGPCGIDGPTDPVIYEDEFIRSKVEIPRKCRRCRFLFHDYIHGFTCSKDPEKWGYCYRGLDWGAWSPERIYFQLPSPKLTTKVLSDSVYDNNLAVFIIEYRRINPDISMAEARDDFAGLRELVAQQTAQAGREGGSVM